MATRRATTVAYRLDFCFGEKTVCTPLAASGFALQGAGRRTTSCILYTDGISHMNEKHTPIPVKTLLLLSAFSFSRVALVVGFLAAPSYPSNPRLDVVPDYTSAYICRGTRWRPTPAPHRAGF